MGADSLRLEYCTPTPDFALYADGPGEVRPKFTLACSADRKTFAAWSRLEEPKPNCAALSRVESTMRPMEEGEAYAPGPGTAV